MNDTYGAHILDPHDQHHGSLQVTHYSRWLT